MILNSKNVVLQPIEKDDINYIHLKSSDFSYLSKTFPTKVRSKMYWKERFNQTGLWDDNYGMLKISENKTSDPFGIIWFFNPWKADHILGTEISFRILDKNLLNEKRNLYDAIKIFCAYLFETYPYQRIQINTLMTVRENMNEVELAKNTGFKYEGTQRKIYFCRGEYRDLQLYSILRNESETLSSLLS